MTEKQIPIIKYKLKGKLFDIYRDLAVDNADCSQFVSQAAGVQKNNGQKENQIDVSRVAENQNQRTLRQVVKEEFIASPALTASRKLERIAQRKHFDTFEYDCDATLKVAPRVPVVITGTAENNPSGFGYYRKKSKNNYRIVYEKIRKPIPNNPAIRIDRRYAGEEYVPFQYTDELEQKVSGWLHRIDFVTTDEEFLKDVALEEKRKRSHGERSYEMPTTRELKAVFTILTEGNAQSRRNMGMFWSGDKIEDGKYIYDSMLSAHQLARILQFHSLEMTDAGYNTEKHSEFQDLGKLIKFFLKDVNAQALKDSGIFELKDENGKSLIEVIDHTDEHGRVWYQEVKGVSPGKWWDVASANFALGQRGLVWCTHATEFKSYWDTTESLLKEGINVTWVKKEYPILIKGLLENKVTGIVEIYNDMVHVTHIREYSQEASRNQRSTRFNNLPEFVNDKLFLELVVENGEEMRKNLNERIKDADYLKSPDRNRLEAGKAKLTGTPRALDGNQKVSPDVDTRTGGVKM